MMLATAFDNFCSPVFLRNRNGPVEINLTILHEHDMSDQFIQFR